MVIYAYRPNIRRWVALLYLVLSVVAGLLIGYSTARAEESEPDNRRLQNIKMIATGDTHTCALTNDGAVKCWGFNRSGQLGNGTNAQSSIPVSVIGLASGVKAIATGSAHSCAVLDAGGVKCWGSNFRGQLGNGTTKNSLVPVNVFDLQEDVIGIAIGGVHTCVLVQDGAMKCWGYNGSGQLGDGTTTDKLIPTNVKDFGDVKAVAISAGDNHTCILNLVGSVKCWGANYDGQLGNGTTVDSISPVDVVALNSGVRQISTEKEHNCALLQNGGVKCWGANFRGQLGDGTTVDRFVPTDVIGLSNEIKELAVGASHSCVVTTSGEVRCWGENSFGQLGDGSTIDKFTQVKVEGLGVEITTIGLGGDHTCAVTIAGSVKCWGHNPYGQLGYGIEGNKLLPTESVELRDLVSSVESGYFHTCVVLVTGSLKCWGYNNAGNLGDGTTASKKSPVEVIGLNNSILSASPYYLHTCALTTSHGVKCWGDNIFGRLGDGSMEPRHTPADVTGLDMRVAAISAGNLHTCALTITGIVKCWGQNENGELGDGTTIYKLTPVDVIGIDTKATAIDAGSQHTCALLVSGNVNCWGTNSFGQLGDGTNENRFAPVAVGVLDNGNTNSISAGGNHTCALSKLGSVKCWGLNGFGQLGDDTTSNRVSPVDVVGLSSQVDAISAGFSHTCALTTVGNVKCWGLNTFGQLGDGTNVQRLMPVDVIGLDSNTVIAISSGGYHTCALINNGKIKCWGLNYSGQLGDSSAWQTTPVDVVAEIEPLIFIPGTMGSRLAISGQDNDVWPGGPFTDHAPLSLRPGEEKPIIIPDALRQFKIDGLESVTDPQIIYEPLLQMLRGAGYVEYEIGDNPIRRTEEGCDLTQQARNPTLFVFAYDWRKDIADAAVKLKDYIACIHRFYPDAKVNILAHSMGGLVARRYAIDTLQDNEPHYINRQITIGTPWWGSPTGYNVLQTGEYGTINSLIAKPLLRTLAEYFPGAHQLLPSESYFQHVDATFAEGGWDVNRNGNNSEVYDYASWLNTANDIYPRGRVCESESLCQVGSNNQAFHAVSGQDVWKNTVTGIEYSYIFGIQSNDKTVVRVNALEEPLCDMNTVPIECHSERVFFPTLGRGDGTVPEISARRGIKIATVDGDKIGTYPFVPEGGLRGAKDDTVEHLGLTKNSDVHRVILNILNGTSAVDAAAELNQAEGASEPAYYVTAYGVGNGLVTNSSNLSTGVVSDTFTIHDAAEVAYITIGENAFSTVIPSLGIYTLTVKSGTSPLFIEVRKGTGDSTSEAIRYQDLELPANVTVTITLGLPSAPQLFYDGNHDGVAETLVQPTVNVTGTQAADMIPPTVTVQSAQINASIQITINAQDLGSGVEKIYYSLDGDHFQPYTAPLAVTAGQAAAIYAFADDKVANRSSLVTYTLPEEERRIYLPLVQR